MMILRSRLWLLAAGLMALPVASALAQQNNPTGNMGSNRSSTASAGTADSKTASGMNTGDVGSHATGTKGYSASAMNSSTKGGTGHTVVPGSNSSQRGDATSTSEQQTGGTSGGAK